VNVGIDGALPETADRISTFPDGAGFVWSAATLDNARATLQVAAPGEHTINVWMREDGFILDKILMTSSAQYQPTGVGPVESNRGQLTLNIARDGNSVVITWSGTAGLQSSDRVDGGWVNETGNSPFQVTPSAPRKFYRLVQTP